MTAKPFTDEWRKEGVVIEVDTDGILLKRRPNEERINVFMAAAVKKTFGIDRCNLILEEEVFERGFIHKMKNYMLIEKDKHGNVHEVLHGAYFKSSRASKVYDDAVQNIVKWALYDKLEEQEARDVSLDIRARPIEDFVMRVKLSKNIKDYISSATEFYDDVDDGSAGFNPIVHENVYKSDFSLSGHQIIHLANQCRAITGQFPEKGMTIEYFTATDAFTGKKTYEYFNPSDDTLLSRLNYEMYEKQINKLFEATNIASYKRRASEENWLESLI